VDQALGIFPVSENGKIDENKVASSTVGGQPAFWVSYFNFDSEVSAYYLTSDQQAAEIRFTLYPKENQPGLEPGPAEQPRPPARQLLPAGRYPAYPKVPTNAVAWGQPADKKNWK